MLNLSKCRIFGKITSKQTSWVECGHCHFQYCIPGPDFVNVTCEKCNSSFIERLEMSCNGKPSWWKGENK